jgi:hypothetical protein
VTPRNLAHRTDAERFLQEFRERLPRFGLELHADKARLIEFGRFAARDRKYRGERKPETFTFLGFTHFCGQLNRIGFRLQGDPEPLDTHGIAVSLNYTRAMQMRE